MSANIDLLNNLTKGGKEELALALHLWKDFKRDGKLDIKIFKDVFAFADMLGIRQEYDELDKKLLFSFKITMNS